MFMAHYDASLGAGRNRLIGLDAAGERQRAGDERRLEHAIVEQRREPVQNRRGCG
jgi:hypothetical protein